MRVEGVLQIQRIKIKVPPNFPKGQIPVLIQETSRIDRRRHRRINADRLLLDRRVSKVYFREVVEELNEKGKVYEKIWTVENIFYPNIFISVLSNKGSPLLTLSLNFRNYNYYPPQVGFLAPTGELIISLVNDVIIPDEKGIKHLIKHGYGLWACTPGTYEYHDFYFDLDRWELERYGIGHNIIELINRIIMMIDRTNESVVESAVQ